MFSICSPVDQTLVVLFPGKILLSTRAAVDTVDKNGRTALMEASSGWHSHVVEVRSLELICRSYNTCVC